MIDKVTPNNPVWINRHEGHMYLANSLALEIAGLLNKNVPDIEGGTIEKDQNGMPTGIFKDKAISLVFETIPVPSIEEYEKDLEAAMNYCIENGNTSVHNMTEPAERNRGGIPNDLKIFEKLKDKLRLRIHVATPLESWTELAEKKKTKKIMTHFFNLVL